MALLQILYLFIPAYVANMTPVFVKKINFLNKPVDLGRTWNGLRILGDHKTYRGFFFGTLSATIFFEIQRLLYNQGIWQNMAFINYSTAPFFLGTLIGFSALVGDSVKSFFKRRLNIRPGRPWVPFDQLDFIIFSMIATAYFTKITLKESLIALLVILFFDMLVQYMGYKLKLKNDVL